MGPLRRARDDESVPVAGEVEAAAGRARGVGMFEDARGSGTVAALAALLVAAAPAMLRAQDGGPGSVFPLTLHAASGVVLPVGTLSRLERAGPSVGVGASWWLQPRIAIRLDGSAGFPEGRSAGYPGVTVDHVPDMQIWHYLAGVELRLTPRVSPWDVSVDLEGGGTTVGTTDSPAFEGTDFTHTYLTGSGGLRVAYRLSPDVDLFADGQADVMDMKKSQTAVFALTSSRVSPDGFGGGVTLPVQVGIQVGFSPTS